MKVVETSPGHLEITCEISQRPFVRSNENGMFCDAEVCVCEQQSQQVSGELWERLWSPHKGHGRYDEIVQLEGVVPLSNDGSAALVALV